MGARRRRLGVTAWAGLGLALVTAQPAAAQFSPRIQLAWVNDHVAGFVFGVETRQPIGALPPQPAEGPRVIATRDWMLTGMAGLGLNFNPPPDHDFPLLIQAHGGFMRRLSGDFEPRVGVVALLYMPAGVAGPAARVELMDVAVVQAGWMFDAGLHVGLEVAARFVRDLVRP